MLRLIVRARSMLAWAVVVGLVARASAEVVGGPLPAGCDIENNYGRSMDVLDDGRLVVGSAGEFCGWVDILDATGTSVGVLRDPDDASFGAVVAAIGGDVLVGSFGSDRVLRVAPAPVAVGTEYVLPHGPPSAIVAVRRRVAILVLRDGEPDVVYVFGARTGRLRRTIPNPDPAHELRALLVRAGRRLAVVDAEGTVHLLDPESGRVRRTRQGVAPGGSLAADGGKLALAAQAPEGRTAVELRDHRGRLLRTLASPDDAGCFGTALALRGDALLVGAPCTTTLDEFEGTAYLYSATSGALLARFAGVGVSEKLGSTVALMPGAVALGGRGPDTADNGIVRIFPR